MPGRFRTLRRLRADYHDGTLKLDYQFLLNSASTLAMGVRAGPVPTKTIASNAMSFDSNGFLAYAPHNLITDVDDALDSDGLTGQGGAEFTVNDAQSSGGFTNLDVSAGGDSRAWFNADDHDVAAMSAGATITFSFEARSTTGSSGDIVPVSWDGTSFFDDGVKTVGTDWTVVSVALTSSTPAAFVNFYYADLRDESVSSTLFAFDIRKPRIHIGSTDLGYLENISGSALYDQPRFAHDPADGNAKLGLLEEMAAATNVAFQSEDFDTTWVKTNVTVTVDQVAAPDGNTTMDNILETATTAVHTVTGNTHVKATSAQSWTATVFTKGGLGRDFFVLEISDAGSVDRTEVEFDLSDGTISVAVGNFGSFADGVASIEDVGGSIFRCRVSATTNADAAVKTVCKIRAGTGVSSYLGDVTKGMSFWGAQLELGSFPTSYIPTTTAEVTRAKDIRTQTNLDWHNANKGTMFKQGIIPHVSAAEQTLWSIDDGTATDRLRLYMDAAENINFETVNSGDTDGASDGAAVIVVNTVFKAVGTYEDDSVIGYVDGTASAEDTAAGLPVTDAATVSRWGDDSAAGTPASMYTQKEQFWNVVKSAAFVSALTALAFPIVFSAAFSSAFA